MFCAPTNNVVERCKKYKTELKYILKMWIFFTTSTFFFVFYANIQMMEKNSLKLLIKNNKIFTNDII